MHRRLSRVRQTAAFGWWLGELAPTRRGRARILWVAVRLRIRRRFAPARTEPLQIEIASCGQRVPLWVGTMGDLTALADVFLNAEYALERVVQPKVILDLGSHIGVSILYFRLRYPTARIIGVEPDPRNFSRLVRNVGHLENVETLQLAMAEHSGHALLSCGPEGVASSLGRWPGQRTEVETRSLDDLIAGLGLESVDLIKLDVEGSEYSVLRGFSHLDRVSALIGELHPTMLGDDLQKLWNLLNRFDVESHSPNPESIVFKAVRHDEDGPRSRASPSDIH
jgi:FkbM family methyltransferase